MSIITKGFGTSAGGGAIMTRGYGGARIIPPAVFPMLARAEVTGEPIVVRAYEPITPPDEMRLLVFFIIVYRLCQWLYWRAYGK